MKGAEDMPMLKKDNDLEKWVKAIGRNIIDKAEDIGRDTNKVRTVTIYACITPEEILNFDITKNYGVEMMEEKESKEV